MEKLNEKQHTQTTHRRSRNLVEDREPTDDVESREPSCATPGPVGKLPPAVPRAGMSPRVLLAPAYP